MAGGQFKRSSPSEPAAADSTGRQAPVNDLRTAAGPPGRNTPDALRILFSDRNLSWWPVLLFLPARAVLSFLSQTTTAWILWSTGDVTPWESSRGWWTVYGTLTDAGCLLLLVLLLRREGLRLRDVFGLTRINLGPQLRAIPEGMVYLGFLTPRLQSVTNSTWKGAAIVVVFWSSQHLVIPFIPDGTYLVSRLLGALLITSGLLIDRASGGFLDATNLLDDLRRSRSKGLAGALFGIAHVELLNHRLPPIPLRFAHREKTIDPG